MQNNVYFTEGERTTLLSTNTLRNTNLIYNPNQLILSPFSNFARIALLNLNADTFSLNYSDKEGNNYRMMLSKIRKKFIKGKPRKSGTFNAKSTDH